MSVKYKTKKDTLPDLQKRLMELNGKKVNVGVLGGGENAWFAGIHEYGCRIKVTPKMRKYLAARGLYLRKTTTEIVIPERSFIRSGHDEHIGSVMEKADNLIDAATSGKISVETLLEAVGLEMSSKIKEYAVNLSTPKNHPFTVDQKHSSNPLVDSGNMINSITYEVEK